MPLAAKAVHEVQLIIRSALTQATAQGLAHTNVAISARWTRPHARPRRGPETWSVSELSTFIELAVRHRLSPALRLAATTGMRRGEIAGLRWGDWNPDLHRLSISRTRQALAGRSAEFATKTRTSRRCIDLDPTTETILHDWRSQQHRDGNDTGTRAPMFTTTAGEALPPESISQLFSRLVARSNLPRIRFHDLRHTHASLLVADGVNLEVVSERLGHAHPSFTIHTYQHLIPGMSAQAAHRFAALIDPVDGDRSAGVDERQLTAPGARGPHDERLPDR